MNTIDQIKNYLDTILEYESDIISLNKSGFDKLKLLYE